MTKASMATSEPVLGALIPTGWGKGGGLSFLYVGITFSNSNMSHHCDGTVNRYER